MDRSTRFSLLGLAGSIVTVAAAVANVLTGGRYGGIFLTIMITAIFFAFFMVIIARLDRRRERKGDQARKRGD